MVNGQKAPNYSMMAAGTCPTNSIWTSALAIGYTRIWSPGLNHRDTDYDQTSTSGSSIESSEGMVRTAIAIRRLNNALPPITM
ncbi:hypothetical protein ASG35_05640 [Burkholderia sp. Leaf177]|nr:hypothetical protein ASG35_05640 [Burkholderia sp. Leaf177]